jgi:hypothetical protein
MVELGLVRFLAALPPSVEPLTRRTLEACAAQHLLLRRALAVARGVLTDDVFPCGPYEPGQGETPGKVAEWRRPHPPPATQPGVCWYDWLHTAHNLAALMDCRAEVVAELLWMAHVLVRLEHGLKFSSGHRRGDLICAMSDASLCLAALQAKICVIGLLSVGFLSSELRKIHE